MKVDMSWISVIVNFLVTIGVFRVFEYRINKRFDVAAKRDELRYMDKRKLAEQAIAILVNAASDNFRIPPKDPRRIRKVIGHVSVFDEELGGKFSEFIALWSIYLQFVGGKTTIRSEDEARMYVASTKLSERSFNKSQKELIKQFREWL